jgi:hypothetical protein
MVVSQQQCFFGMGIEEFLQATLVSRIQRPQIKGLTANVQDF